MLIGRAMPYMGLALVDMRQVWKGGGGGKQMFFSNSDWLDKVGLVGIRYALTMTKYPI
jgi:hypothetical protein